MTTPTLEEIKEQFLTSSDLKGKYGEIMLNDLILTAKREALREVRDIFKDQSEIGVNHLNMELDRLESELNSGAESK